jgi:hypothetical protein
MHLAPLILLLCFPAADEVRVSGEELEWKVETPFLVADFRRNSGTGRSGQLNTIFLKDPGVLLTRDRPTSTLHLSPNSAAGRRWAGINRWDPPRSFQSRRVSGGFRIDREGEMPGVPGLTVRTSYEVPPGLPAMAVEESVEARQAVEVNLLRLCEWSSAPGPGNPFTHVAWEDANGNTVVRTREQAAGPLPLDVRWQAFFSASKSFGFAAVVERLDTGGSPLRSPASLFSGDPHYFSRVLLQGPEGALLKVPVGARYFTRYWIYLFRAPDAASGAEAVRKFRLERDAAAAGR